MKRHVIILFQKHTMPHVIESGYERLPRKGIIFWIKYLGYKIKGYEVTIMED